MDRGSINEARFHLPLQHAAAPALLRLRFDAQALSLNRLEFGPVILVHLHSVAAGALDFLPFSADFGEQFPRRRHPALRLGRRFIKPVDLNGFHQGRRGEIILQPKGLPRIGPSVPSLCADVIAALRVDAVIHRLEFEVTGG